MSRVTNFSLAVLMIAGGLLAPAWLGFAGHPEHRVRTSPLLTHTGLIGSDATVGQRFLCEGAGLRRIDVSLVALKQAGTRLELVLREGDAEGPVVRRVELLPDPARDQQLLPFAFEPIPESSGRWYHFQLAPAGGHALADHSAWIRFHGKAGVNDAWGDRALETRFVQETFRSPLDNLRAIAVASEHLSTERGEVRLELFRTDRASEPLRVARLTSPTAIRGGYAFFSFPPIQGSAGEDYGFLVASEGSARFVGRGDAPSFKTFHATPGARPGMAGMTSNGQSLEDRDLVFRAWSDYSPARGLRVAAERAGWKLWVAVACWTGAVLALVRMLASATRRPTRGPSARQ